MPGARDKEQIYLLYINTDFCTLSLNPATLLYLFILTYLYTCRYKETLLSSANKDLFSSFPIHIPFISSSCITTNFE